MISNMTINLTAPKTLTDLHTEVSYLTDTAYVYLLIEFSDLQMIEIYALENGSPMYLPANMDAVTVLPSREAVQARITSIWRQTR